MNGNSRSARRSSWISTQVRLTMPDPVVASADAAYHRLMDLRQLAPGGKGVHDADWVTVHGQLDAARQSFRDEVRVRLDMTTD
jgi:hypothetical protein